MTDKSDSEFLQRCRLRDAAKKRSDFDPSKFPHKPDDHRKLTADEVYKAAAIEAAEVEVAAEEYRPVVLPAAKLMEKGKAFATFDSIAKGDPHFGEWNHKEAKGIAAGAAEGPSSWQTAGNNQLPDLLKYEGRVDLIARSGDKNIRREGVVTVKDSISPVVHYGAAGNDPSFQEAAQSLGTRFAARVKAEATRRGYVGFFLGGGHVDNVDHVWIDEHGVRHTRLPENVWQTRSETATCADYLLPFLVAAALEKSVSHEAETQLRVEMANAVQRLSAVEADVLANTEQLGRKVGEAAAVVDQCRRAESLMVARREFLKSYRGEHHVLTAAASRQEPQHA